MEKYYKNRIRKDLYNGLIVCDERAEEHSLFSTHKVINFLEFFGELSENQLE